MYRAVHSCTHTKMMFAIPDPDEARIMAQLTFGADGFNLTLFRRHRCGKGRWRRPA